MFKMSCHSLMEPLESQSLALGRNSNSKSSHSTHSQSIHNIDKLSSCEAENTRQSLAKALSLQCKRNASGMLTKFRLQCSQNYFRLLNMRLKKKQTTHPKTACFDFYLHTIQPSYLPACSTYHQTKQFQVSLITSKAEIPMSYLLNSNLAQYIHINTLPLKECKHSGSKWNTLIFFSQFTQLSLLFTFSNSNFN